MYDSVNRPAANVTECKCEITDSEALPIRHRGRYFSKHKSFYQRSGFREDKPKRKWRMGGQYLSRVPRGRSA